SPTTWERGKGGEGHPSAPVPPLGEPVADSPSPTTWERGKGGEGHPSAPVPPLGEPVADSPSPTTWERGKGGEGHPSAPMAPLADARKLDAIAPAPTTWERMTGGEGHPSSPVTPLADAKKLDADSPAPTLWERGPGGEGHPGHPHHHHPPLALFWLPLVLLGLGWLVGFPLLALGGLGVLAFWRALTLAQRPAASFALLVVALGCAIIFGTEVIFIRDVFGTRMNTIFKFYYQVWLLWGMLAPFALWWMLRYARGRWGRGLAWGASALSLVLLAGALVYPWLALGELGRGPWVGLQGHTPRETHASGMDAVAWLRRMAPPGSVVLEAAAVDNGAAVAAGLEAPRCGGSYNGEGFGGVAAATGLPTLLGWDGHQRQWRGGDPEALAELGPRCAAADTIYRTLDVERARELLQRYNVAYVYVGELERYRYPAEALAKFATLGEVVFSADEVRIYRVW
ncbi:MAG: hypothetical protein EI684_05930, partial [Candidatus Viridilinea halotolerans]